MSLKNTKMKMKNLILWLLMSLTFSVFTQEVTDTLLQELTDYPNSYLVCPSCSYKVFMNEEFSVLLFDRDKKLIEKYTSTKAQQIENLYLAEFATEKAESVVIKTQKATFPLINDFISLQKTDNSGAPLRDLNDIIILPKDRYYFIITSKSPLILFKDARIRKGEASEEEEDIEIQPALVRFYLECPHQAVAVVGKDQQKIKAVSVCGKKELSLEEFLISFKEEEDITKIEIKDKAKSTWKNLRISLYDPCLDKVFVPEKEEFKIEKKEKEPKKPLSRFLVRFVEVVK